MIRELFLLLRFFSHLIFELFLNFVHTHQYRARVTRFGLASLGPQCICDLILLQYVTFLIEVWFSKYIIMSSQHGMLRREMSDNNIPSEQVQEES